jgi:hypothetical protein
MSFTKLEKTDVVFDLWRSPWTVRQIYGDRLSQKILSNARTFVNVVQHLSDFGCFEMNKRDLDHQREDRILVAQLLVHSSPHLKVSLPAVINY